MFNFFKKSPPLQSFASLGLDLHSHLLPGIADGAKTVEDSLGLIRRLQAMGFERFITTPHVMSDLYPNTPAIIKEKLGEVRAAAAREGLKEEIAAAAEYLLDEAFGEKIANDELLTLPGKRVLVEMSFVSAPPNLDQYIFKLQTKGYKVILAHPERYLFLRDNEDRVESLKSRGVEFQLNLLSLIGYYGKPIQEHAERLLKAGLVDYLATDLHHERHAANLQQMLTDRKLAKLLNPYLGQFRNRELMAVAEKDSIA